MKKALFLFILCFYGYLGNTQLAEDALRLSTLNPSLSTARTAAVAGAFGAMGEDFGVLNINPAGIASYYSSEISFSPSINTNASSASLVNRSSDSNSSNFGLGNIGVVLSRAPVASIWSSFNFAIGVNKQSIFSQEFLYEGSTPTSIVDRFAQLAAGNTPEELGSFEAALAYNTFALDVYDPVTQTYSTDFDNYSGVVNKNQSVTRTGNINELTFGWAGSIKKKFAIGASVGVPLVSYETTKIYRENDVDNDIEFFERLSFTEYISTSGAGLNFKLGTTYTGLKNFRLGLAVHSPNWYRLTDDFYNTLSYTYQGVDGEEFNEEDSPNGRFNYRLSTPWKYIASAGSIFKIGDIRGFVNADFEFINYANSAFNLSSSDQSSPEDAAYQEVVNADINEQYQQVMNIRLGTEIGYQIWRLRGGIALEASPYANGSAGNNTTIGLGLGIKKRTYSLDIAYQASNNEEAYSPYRLNDESQNPIVNIESQVSNITATLGFRF